MQSVLRYGLTLASVLAVACSGKTEPPGDACPVGNEGCLCYGNGTCNNGLDCRSNRCVSLGTGGSGATGATSLGGAMSSGGWVDVGLGGNLAGGAIYGVGGMNPAGGASFGVGGSNRVLDPSYCNGLLSGQICSQPSLQADVRAVNMLLVVDASGSMKFPASATATATKWSELNQALTSVLPSFGSDVNFGLELFPYDPAGTVDTSNPDSACSVSSAGISGEIAAGAANLSTILDLLRNRTPAGGTPMTKALQQAYAYFTQGNGRSLNGSKSIVLITDGGPNCNSVLQCGADTCTQNLDGQCGDGTTSLNCCDTTTASGAANKANMSCLDDAAAVTQISNLKAAGIATMVVGLPGSEPYLSTLNAMANAGGLPNSTGTAGTSYYAVSASNSLQGLKDVLANIVSTQFRTCDIWLTLSPSSASAVQAVSDCQFVPQLPANKPPTPDGGTPDGYYIDFSKSPAHLVLTGTTCNSIIGVVGRDLDLIVGCRSPD